MIDIQYDIIILGGREVSRPYWNWFFAEGERFFMFFVSVPPVFIHRTLLMQLAKCQCIRNMLKACPYVILDCFFDITFFILVLR